MGFEVTDNDLASGIRAMIPPLFPDGKFVGKESYAAFLAQQNLSIPEYESEMSRLVLFAKLRQILVEGTVVSNRQIEQEYKRRSDKSFCQLSCRP